MNQAAQRPIIAATTTATRPQPSALLDQVIAQTSRGFDVEAYHVMNERDNSLIADEVLNGAGSSKFVYQFSVAGTNVTGISVVGARHLASKYGGLRHRMVASTLKRGSLFTFTSYPADGSPMRVTAQVIPELSDEDDFYSALIEITDVKMGNTIQVEAAETRQEKRRDGSRFDRPHYQKIAQSKAYRNGILSVIPQDVQLEWKEQQLKLGKQDVITRSVIDEKRAGVMQFAAAKGIPVDRHKIEDLTMDQIAGLAEAARTRETAQFTNAASALGILRQQAEPETAEAAAADAPAATQPPKQQSRRVPPRSRAQPEQPAETPHDPETGEITNAPADQAEPEPAEEQSTQPHGSDLF